MSDSLMLTEEQKFILKILRGECNQEIFYNLDYKYILNYAMEGKFFNWFYRQIKQIIPGQYKELYRNEYLKLQRRIQMQLSEMERIVSYFNKKGLDYIIVKGSVLSQIIYDDYSLRQSSDIDIIVPELKLNTAYKYLENLGYKFCAGYDFKRNDLDLLEAPFFLYFYDYHEYQCALEIKKGEYLKVEIKRNTSAIPFQYIKDFWGAREFVKIENKQYVTFDLLHTLLHLFANIYENIVEEMSILKGRYFRDIIDLFFFMEKYIDIDWNIIFDFSNKYEMTHKIFAVMNILNSVYLNYFSQEICEIFNPKNITYKYNGNESGEKFLWKSDFLIRAFNKDLRIREYSVNKKSEVFYGKNLDSSVKFHLSNNHEYLLERNICLNNAMNFKVTLSYVFSNRMIFFLFSYEKDQLKKGIFPYISFCNNSKELYKEIYFDFNDYTFSTNSKESIMKIIDKGDYSECYVEIKKEELFENGDIVCCLLEFRKKIGKVGFCRVSDIYNFYLIID